MFWSDIDEWGCIQPQAMFEIVDYEHTIRCMGRIAYDVSCDVTPLFSDAL